MAKKNTIKQVEELLGEYLEENGYALYHVELVKEGQDHFLRIFIDKSPGAEEPYIGTEDCEKVSGYIGPILDQQDLIKDAYYLEVSSPGMDRSLITSAHYRQYLGEEVDLALYEPFEGEKNITATLLDADEEDIRIKKEDREWVLPRKKIAKATLTIKGW